MSTIDLLAELETCAKAAKRTRMRHIERMFRAAIDKIRELQEADSAEGTPDRFPEHRKLLAQGKRQENVADFMEWMESHNLHFARFSDKGVTPAEWENPTIMAQYLGIDEIGLEREKRIMLDEIRNKEPA